MKIQRLESAGLVRWIAALLVMAGHMYCLLLETPPSILWNALQRLGILFFFVLGGYLVTGSWASDSKISNYAIKRCVRIFPPLIAFVFVATVIVGPFLSDLSVPEYYGNILFRRYFLNILLYINYALPGVFTINPYPNAVNGSLWSLPVEFLMYIIVPLFYQISKKNVKINVLIVMMLCGLNIVKDLYYPDFRFVIYGMDVGSMLAVVPFYFIGMLVYILQEKELFDFRFNAEMSGVVLFISVIFSSISILLADIVSFLFVPYVVFSLAHAKQNRITKFLANQEITYGIYLYGFFIQQIVIYLNYKYDWQSGILPIFIVSLAITILLASLSARFIEKPLIRWSKSLLK
jgi:peptidoglycan/LPS O-acetylase OafA/YrhL